jgi:AcrR family transcriptional regulator
MGAMSAAGTSTQRSIRERLIAAAVRMTAEHGWAFLTMGKLAEQVGVSRQTVYNELGSKSQLAEAMIMSELAHFLSVVDTAFRENPADLVAAIRAAAEAVLLMGENDPLLRAVLASRQGAETDLLPLLTTHSEPLLDAARQMIREHVAGYALPLEDHRLELLIDMVVRLVLSHVMQPGGAPAETAETIAWLAEKVLASAGQLAES